MGSGTKVQGPKSGLSERRADNPSVWSVPMMMGYRWILYNLKRRLVVVNERSLEGPDSFRPYPRLPHLMHLRTWQTLSPSKFACKNPERRNSGQDLLRYLVLRLGCVISGSNRGEGRIVPQPTVCLDARSHQ